jgi:hypothetical protein
MMDGLFGVLPAKVNSRSGQSLQVLTYRQKPAFFIGIGAGIQLCDLLTLAANFVAKIDVKDLQALPLGAARSCLKDQLSSQLGKIDSLVAMLWTGKSEAHQTTIGKRRLHPPKTDGLFD